MPPVWSIVPARLAQDAAMLDHLSRGRLEFGAGTGVSPHEFMRWNTHFERRREISEEALEIILATAPRYLGPAIYGLIAWSALDAS